MAEVSVTREYQVNPENLWNKVSEFNNMHVASV